ncbi:hypothetical protein [Pseudoalteromonas luteoviolacea]|uniref:Uncharacterized protein n=1 Tax=Pseudoalteromonas luteoviolacea S4060-1 TaxID=1365257 RepID=A0A167JVX2_9GAMM|nr:hypothetical protein [Pseudoalteromonas luteoviolacea]KZN61743.1 hypothetical protein N478_06660 [Pseudoalteromonas luteoviolacea S4060-1]
MTELFEGLFYTVARVVLGILRLLHFLAWHIGFSTVGWSIGWYFYRSLSIGFFPRESLDDEESCHWFKALVIELSGLMILISVIKVLSGLL